ncbi:MAG: hypothetical protein KF744_11580 [Taibaiella sp.]|nr:hypothetical protein [Taibaiella sp.]
MKHTILALLAGAMLAGSCSKSSSSSLSSSGYSCVCSLRWMGGSVANPTYKDTTMTYKYSGIDGAYARNKCDSQQGYMWITYGRAHSGNNYVGASCSLK